MHPRVVKLVNESNKQVFKNSSPKKLNESDIELKNIILPSAESTPKKKTSSSKSGFELTSLGNNSLAMDYSTIHEENISNKSPISHRTRKQVKRKLNSSALTESFMEPSRHKQQNLKQEQKKKRQETVYRRLGMTKEDMEKEKLLMKKWKKSAH